MLFVADVEDPAVLGSEGFYTTARSAIASQTDAERRSATKLWVSSFERQTIQDNWIRSPRVLKIGKYMLGAKT